MFKKNAICGSITESLYLEMGKQIVGGSFLSDTHALSEDLVCARFQVSRSVSREAIKILAAKGLIALRPKTGIEINHISHWNLFDRDVLNWVTSGDLLAENFGHISQIRKLVEPEVIRDLCSYSDAISRRKLREIVNIMSISRENQQEFRKYQVSFHIALLKASKNPFFNLFSELIVNTLGKSTSPPKKVTKEQLLQYYTDMLDAIECRNQSTAATLCKVIIEAESFT